MNKSFTESLPFKSGFEQEAKDNLILLIEKFNNLQVSAIVGAGFSKNASLKFPLWTELLAGMVNDLFSDEIGMVLKSVCRNRKAARESIIAKIIDREGLLKIPQLYIDRKGRREALTLYIEDFFSGIDENTNNDLSVHKDFLKLSWVDICTTNYDTLLEQSEDQISEEWKIVNRAKDLKKGNNGRIVKIHGDLRKNYSEQSVFDDYHRHQYIITENDFNLYQEEHNGFTAFMQVKILQDSLCLFGFSGNDPNFLKWVEWLRLTMTKGETSEEPNPIFLIDNSSTPSINEETRLFYKNNKIRWIPLYALSSLFLESLNKNVFNEEKKEKFDINNRKALLLLFFKYIARSVRKWRGYTQEISKTHHDERIKWEESLKKFNNVFDCDQLVSIISAKFPDRKVLKIPFLFAHNYISNLLSPMLKCSTSLENKVDIKTYRLISFVLENQLLLPSHVFKPDVLKFLMTEFENIDINSLDSKDILYWFDFAILILKDYRFKQKEKEFFVWKNRLKKLLEELSFDEFERNNFRSSLQYEEGLLYLNLLREHELDELLDSWNPKETSSNLGFWLIKKAFLLTSLQKKSMEALELLQKAEEVKTKPEERLWLLEIYQHYYWDVYIRKDDRIDAEITGLKNRGFYTLESMTKDFIKNTSSENKIITKPSEKFRYSGKSRTINFNGLSQGDNTFWKNVEFIRFIEETGIPLLLENTLWSGFSYEKWLTVFETLYQQYPQKILSYSMRFMDRSSDEEFSIKIFQYLIFSDNFTLENFISLFQDFEKLFWNRFKNDGSIRSLLFIISEIIRILPYEVWASFIQKLWSSIEKDDDNKIRFWFFRTRVWGWLPCFQKIIPLIEDNDLLSRMVKLMLKSNREELLDYRDSLLYFNALRSNPDFEKVIHILSKDKGFIKQLLEGSSEIRKSIVRNIYHFLDENVQQKISNRIKETKQVYESVDIVNFFKHTFFRNLLKEKIFSKIADLPIKRYPDDDFSVFTFLTENKVWSKEEKLELFKRMYEVWDTRIADSLYEGIDSKTGEDYQKEFKIGSVYWIYFYLIYEKEFLKETVSYYESFFNKVRGQYYKLKELDVWEKKILIEDEVHFNVYASTVINEIFFAYNSDLVKAWDIILNRLLLTGSPYFEAVFEGIANTLWNRRETKEHWVFKSEKIYLLILQKYVDSLSRNMDRIFMEQQLSLIAESLQFVGVRDNVIDAWLVKKKNSRYKEVRDFNLY